MKWLWNWISSLKTTILLFVILAELLLISIVVPQEAMLGAKEFHDMLVGRPMLQFVFVTLGFARMATSPLFVGTWILFFVNLTAVMAKRLRPTFRRVRLRPPSEARLRAWLEKAPPVERALGDGWTSSQVASVLRGYGYVPRRPSANTAWGLKNRTAALGFLVFHASFFLMCAGGIAIYYTRLSGTVSLAEGQSYTGERLRIGREPPSGTRPSVAFDVVAVEPRIERGRPVSLEAVLRLREQGRTREQRVRVNHPAVWGSTSILVEKTGVAPVFWLTDANGLTRDRAAVLAGTEPDVARATSLAGGEISLSVEPVVMDESFPSREQIGRAPVRITIQKAGQYAFSGEVRPGTRVDVDGWSLLHEANRYWVGLRLVDERGGALLVFGFVVAVLGLVWRMVWYRREVGIVWDATHIRVVGRSEYFPETFERELETLANTLVAQAGSSAGKEENMS